MTVRELQIIGVSIASVKATFDAQVAVEKDLDPAQAHALAIQVALKRFEQETKDLQPDDLPRVVSTQFRGLVLLPIS